METFTIGQMAKQARVHVETVRYYERRGLLAQPPRPVLGRRNYSPEHVARIRFIKRAQELGFSLNEIDELLSLRVDPNSSCSEVKERVTRKIATVREKIHHLRQIETALGELETACNGKGPTSQCPVLEVFEKGS